MKYYNFSPVHSVQPNFSFPTGDPIGPGSSDADGGCSIWGLLDPANPGKKNFAPEFKHSLKHAAMGTVSMATAPNPDNPDERYAGSQFDGAVVDAGRTAGADQRATGWFDGQPWLEVSMTLHVDPASAGLSPTDRIELEGRHGLTVTVDPGCRALLSTAAMIVNGLPRAIAAPPRHPGRPAARTSRAAAADIR